MSISPSHKKSVRLRLSGALHSFLLTGLHASWAVLWLFRDTRRIGDSCHRVMGRKREVGHCIVCLFY